MDDEFANKVLDSMSFGTFVAERGSPHRACDVFDQVTYACNVIDQVTHACDVFDQLTCTYQTRDAQHVDGLSTMNVAAL